MQYLLFSCPTAVDNPRSRPQEQDGMQSNPTACRSLAAVVEGEDLGHLVVFLWLLRLPHLRWPCKASIWDAAGMKSPSSLLGWIGLCVVPLEDICLGSELSADRRLMATPAWDNHSWEMKSAVRHTNSIKEHNSMKHSMDTDVRKYWFRWSVLAPLPSFWQCYGRNNNPSLKEKPRSQS